jgi:hypothetical protein
MRVVCYIVGGDAMAKTSKAQLDAVKRHKSGLGELRIYVPKARKAEISAYAAAGGESLTGYVVRLIDEDMTKKAPDA